MSVIRNKGLKRLFVPNSNLKSRLHTPGGDFLPLSGWVRIPLTLYERLSNVPRPWMSTAAIQFLDRTMQPTWSVLELGAGNSTVWLEKRCSKLISFETKSEWYSDLRSRVSSDLRLVEAVDVLAAIQALDETFDMVLVDFTGDRAATLTRAADLTKPDGILVLDDAERYPEADTILEGWAKRRLISMRARPFNAHETAVYRKPSE